MTTNMLNIENAYCILSFTSNAGLSKWLSGRHLNASLAWAIRKEPEIYSKDRNNLMSYWDMFLTMQGDCAEKMLQICAPVVA
jgi:hypothetical protein